MAIIDLDAGNVYITDSRLITDMDITTNSSQKVVKIASTKLDYNYDNQIGVIPILVSSGRRGELKDADQEPFARAIDLKRIAEAITVQGFLEDESGESAITKRDNLLTIAKTGGALSIVWGIGPYQTVWKTETNAKDGTGIFISKMTFTETVGIIGEGVSVNPQPERNIAVQLQVIRGKDLV